MTSSCGLFLHTGVSFEVDTYRLKSLPSLLIGCVMQSFYPMVTSRVSVDKDVGILISMGGSRYRGAVLCTSLSPVVSDDPCLNPKPFRPAPGFLARRWWPLPRCEVA